VYQRTKGESDRAAWEREKSLLDAAERIAGLGSWQVVVETGEILWSGNCFRLLGFEPGEIEPSAEAILDLAHPDDRDILAAEIEAVLSGAGSQKIEFRIVLADGAIRHLGSRRVTVDREGPPRVVGTLQDITEQRRVDRTIAAHLAVSEALVEWDSFETGASRLLGRLGTALGFAVGALWLPQDGVLACRAFWHTRAVDAGEFETATRQLRLPRGAGMLGRSWQGHQPLVVANVLKESGYLRAAAAKLAGLRGAIAFPAVRGDEVLAVLDFHGREEIQPSPQMLRSLTSISHELGQFLAVHRGELRPAILTAREHEVLQLAAEGRNGPVIAQQLGLSTDTIKTHFKHINEKLEVSSRAAAVAAGIREGLID